jgi:hypothetical protein
MVLPQYQGLFQVRFDSVRFGIVTLVLMQNLILTFILTLILTLERTHFVFRSRSARIIWLVQISSEMWEYDQNGMKTLVISLSFSIFLFLFLSLSLSLSLSPSFFVSIYYITFRPNLLSLICSLYLILILGDLYFEKFLNQFADPLFDRWKSLAVTHSLTVVFFARTLYLDGVDPIHTPDLCSKASLQKRSDGVLYQDFFKVTIVML